MTKQQEKLVLEAWRYCDENEKSDEFLIQYASDVSGVDESEVIDFIIDYDDPKNENDEENS